MSPTPFVVWDLDGTLVDSGQDIANAANRVRVSLGFGPLPDEVIRSYVGEGAARLIDRVVGEHEPEALRKEALARFYEVYGAHLVVHTRPYAGIDALVRKLSGKQAIATNKPGHMARSLVSQLGWAAHFRQVLGSDEVPRRKPAPDIVFRALDLCGVRLEDAIFVGDSPVDIATAEAAKIRFVCVSWGLRPRDELLSAPLVVDTAEELERALFS